jgi:hypothetical protein
MRTISTLLATALSVGALVSAGCSSGAKDPMKPGNQVNGMGGSGGSGAGGSGGGNPGGGGGKGAPPAQGSCDTPQLEVLFTPMYTAYDGVHQFRIPAVVNSIDPSAVTWSASDPSFVDVQSDPSTGGILITARKAGSVKIIASAGGLCGVSLLTISSAMADDWMVGSARYNDGIAISRPPRGDGITDGGVNTREAACTNCHGDTATMGPFKTVAHTPQQTGGFSDEELIGIFTMGIVPMGGYFDTTIVSYDNWQRFHRWQMTPDQARGMVVYLRSLTPQPQGGMRGDFGGRTGDGGRRIGDGGRSGDGGGRREGGREGGSPADASATD